MLPNIIWYVASSLVRPSVFVTLLSAAGLACLFVRRLTEIGRILLLVGICGQTSLLVLPVDEWLVHPLEEWYPQLRKVPDHVDGIIVLGGALRPSVSSDRDTPGLNSESERMIEFVLLAQEHPEARLVFSGGMGWINRDGATEAQAARRFFDLFGEGDRVIYESASNNTRENAVLSQRLVDVQPGQTWVLLTSAMNMPRAVATFRAIGWNVLPFPTAYRTRHYVPWSLSFELGDRLNLLDGAVHEWVGLVIYWWRGYADFSSGLDANPVLSRQSRSR